MRTHRIATLSLLGWLWIGGCSSPSAGDGGTDSGVPADTMFADGGQDAGHADSGPTDARLDGDAGATMDAAMDAAMDTNGSDVNHPDAPITTDVASDADAMTTLDAGHDTGTVMDTGSTTDTGTTSDTGTPVDVVDVISRPDAQDAGVPPTDTGVVESGTPMCPPMQHVCLCATGYYCLRIGFACLSPSSPCP